MGKVYPTRVTKPTVSVARYLVGLGANSTYGLEIGQHTGLGSASVYAVLDRFEEYGWVDSEWEVDSARRGARRRLYYVTTEGISYLNTLIASADVKDSSAISISKPLNAKAV